MPDPKRESDFMALVMMEGMCCFGRDSDLGKAIDRVKREAKETAKRFGGFKKGEKIEIGINVYDVIDYDIVEITDRGVVGDGLDPIVRMTYFKWVV